MANGTTSAAAATDSPVYNPGIFTTLQSGSGPGLIAHADGTLVSADHPASRGEVVVVYCTGLGAQTNQPLSGAVSPSSPLAQSMVMPTATVNSLPAQVLFAGLAPGFVGVNQVNVQIPADAQPVPNDPEGSVVRLVISVSARQSNTVTVAVQ